MTEAPVPVVVTVSVAKKKLRLDFTGSAPLVPGNVNCPASVTRAAAVFVLRTLLHDDVPTNDGIARAIELVIPDDCALNARWPAAVAAGNVEMSQRITDTIFAALGAAGVDVPAQGQGTMNNVTFGSTVIPSREPAQRALRNLHLKGWTFYETLGGGQGASSSGPGPSAVHVGMSNTLNTPVEALEDAYPLRIDEYALRWRSGGAGVHAGGDGVRRVYRALEPCTVTLLTERRRLAPRGANGGADGARGRNALHGRDLSPKCRESLDAGSQLEIETPGGGGWGAPDAAREP